jgi:hypothetical protein
MTFLGSALNEVDGAMVRELVSNALFPRLHLSSLLLLSLNIPLQ